MNLIPFFWLAAAVFFLVVEASTVSMTSVWFAIGAAAALLTCLFTGSLRAQALVFIVVSALCLWAFRPLAAKLIRKATPTVLTPVTAEVPGRVRLDGVDWNARCVTPGDRLESGERCRIAEIHSTLLLVEPVLTESRKA